MDSFPNFSPNFSFSFFPILILVVVEENVYNTLELVRVDLVGSLKLVRVDLLGS